MWSHVTAGWTSVFSGGDYDKAWQGGYAWYSTTHPEGEKPPDISRQTDSYKAAWFAGAQAAWYDKEVRKRGW